LGTAPVVPGRLEVGRDGKRVGIEPRAVAGRSNAEALRRLQALEGLYRSRVQAVAPEVEVRFLYRRSNGDELAVARELERIERPSALRRLLGRRG
jgi:hypothetical protein